MTCRRVINTAVVLTIITLAVAPAVSQADCTTPLGAPHQGAGKFPAPGNMIYGMSASISYSNPALGCLNRYDSFTDEWVMVVGPGPEEWLQFGWEKNSSYQTVHLWYQYHHQGAGPVGGRIAIDPVTTHEYKIMSDPDRQTGIISWWLVDNGFVRLQFRATDMGWTQPTNGAAQAQWSAEVAYGESEMGGLLPYLVTFSDLTYEEGSPSAYWQQVVEPWTFDSFVPRYGGDTTEVEPFVWQSRNWTWPYQNHLPLLENNP
jgi:hypothetical protein